MIKTITISYNLSGVSIVISREESLLFYFEVKMTVSTTTNKVVYIGNGVATSFAIPFPFLEKEHLKVRQLLNDVQTERTDWMISDGNMVFETAPADGAQILIMREVPLTQETDYRENEILPAETLERNFDKLTMQVQQLKEQAERAITIDVFDNTDAASLIPSIKQAVSDAAVYAATARNEAQEALIQAQTAMNQAEKAVTSEANTAAMLGTKANIDADNFSVAGKRELVGLNTPDYSAGITGTLPFTAPKSGKISVNLSSVANNNTTLYINGVIVGFVGNGSANSGISAVPQFDVSGGDVVTASGGYQAYSYYYFPCKGV